MDSVFIYCFVFIISSMFMSIYGKRRRLFDLFSIIGIAILVVFAAGRYYVGTDFVTYCRIFERSAAAKWVDLLKDVSSEYLFVIVSKITYAYGGRVLTYGTFAFIMVIVTYCVIKTQYSDISLMIAIMVLCFAFYASAFNVTREFIAVAFVFYALKFVYNDKFVYFFICVMIATLFHKSAIIALLMWFLWNHKEHEVIRGYKRFFVVVFVVVFVFSYQDIITYLFTGSNMFSDYLDYTKEGKAGLNRDFYTSLFETTVVLLFYRGVAKNRYNDARIDYLVLFMVIALFTGVTGFFHPQVKRIAYFFSFPATIVLFGYMPKFTDRRYSGLVSLMIVVYFISKFILTAYVIDQGDLIPYEFDLYSDYALDSRNYYAH